MDIHRKEVSDNDSPSDSNTFYTHYWTAKDECSSTVGAITGRQLSKLVSFLYSMSYATVEVGKQAHSVKMCHWMPALLPIVEETRIGS